MFGYKAAQILILSYLIPQYFRIEIDHFFNETLGFESLVQWPFPCSSCRGLTLMTQIVHIFFRHVFLLFLAETSQICSYKNMHRPLRRKVSRVASQKCSTTLSSARSQNRPPPPNQTLQRGKGQKSSEKKNETPSLLRRPAVEAVTLCSDCMSL